MKEKDIKISLKEELKNGMLEIKFYMSKKTSKILKEHFSKKSYAILRGLKQDKKDIVIIN